MEVLFEIPGGSDSKESACNTGDPGSIPGLGRSPGEGKGYPLQYSGLENAMDCIIHGVAKSQTWLSDFHLLSVYTSVFQFIPSHPPSPHVWKAGLETDRNTGSIVEFWEPLCFHFLLKQPLPLSSFQSCYLRGNSCYRFLCKTPFMYGYKTLSEERWKSL